MTDTFIGTKRGAQRGAQGMPPPEEESPGAGTNKVFSCAAMVAPKRLIVACFGKDGPGTLAFMVKEFLDRRARIEVCTGDTLKFDQGAFFQIVGDDEQKLRALCQEFQTRERTFSGPEFDPAALVQFFDLEVKFRADPMWKELGLTTALFAVTDTLASRGINLDYLRADKVDEFLKSKYDGVVRARMSVPEGVDPQVLPKQVLDACPGHTQVSFRPFEPSGKAGEAVIVRK